MSQPPLDLQNINGQNFVDLSDAIRDAQTLGNPSLLDIVNQLNTNLLHVLAMTEEIRARQPVMNTSIDNLYKRERNKRTNNSDGYSFSQMLGKTITGSGQALAQSLAPESVIVPPLDPSPAIGSIYTLNLKEVDDLTHLDIIRLITFYNEDFGIVVGDDLSARRRKFRFWLTCV